MSDEGVAVEVATDEPKPEKHAGGRPRKYKTPEEFEAKVIEYRDGPDGERLTTSGLVLALGFANHSSLYDYAKYPGFEEVVSWARLLVENSWEKQLYEPSSGGAKFALHGFGERWRDRRDITHHGDPESPIGLLVGRMSDEELLAQAERIAKRIAAIKGNGSDG